MALAGPNRPGASERIGGNATASFEVVVAELLPLEVRMTACELSATSSEWSAQAVSQAGTSVLIEVWPAEAKKQRSASPSLATKP